ncbi:uncharacterized protein BT62DRAFT_928126 [Guyanagaster necrorhizus]|uniref:Uncharacterized protein n=1 Tax=Guyanagaster necrorhizus TaxID=856835 RepID=A0A9P8AWY4_9AGAR|nr:uncharacterized protein BT62DRAFT_928126 [Guyanagaster necrorhizus MCA 3950]KAG7450845.1 hypothetical protein BT62DRAFT_928126 [Guyanagaster necrorhizus MCA 3950]
MAVFNANSGVKVFLIGMGMSNALISINNAATQREALELLASSKHCGIRDAMKLMLCLDSIPPIMDLVTHRVPFNVDAVKKAFEAMARGRG